MKCKNCKHDLNEIKWYDIWVNGVKENRVNDFSKWTDRKIRTLAKSIFANNFCLKPGQTGTVEGYWHCFECGGRKSETIYREIKGFKKPTGNNP